MKKLTREMIVHRRNSRVADAPQGQIFEVGRSRRSTGCVESSVNVTVFAVRRRSDHIHERRSDGTSCRKSSGQSNVSSSHPSPSNLPNGPITPWGQVVHTPTHPPPVAPPQSAQADAQRDRSRLEAAWRANAASTNNRWDLDSPALYPPPHPNLYGTAQVQPSSNSSLSSFSMDRRSLSTPVLSMSTHQASRPTNLLPPLPSPSSLAQNFTASSSSFSPSPLSFAPQQTDYLNSKSIERREEPKVVPTIEREKKPVASKLEQDAFFSNLLGSTTRYVSLVLLPRNRDRKLTMLSMFFHRYTVTS